MKYAVEMASGGMIHMPSFMTIGLGCNVGITDGIYEIAFRWPHVA
jgi:hypothetical protein